MAKNTGIRFALLWIFGAIVFFAAAGNISDAVVGPLMGERMAWEVRRMLYSDEARFPLPAGWKIKQHTFGNRRIEAKLESAEKGTATVFFERRIKRRAPGERWTFFKDTMSFRCGAMGSGAGWKKAAEALRERVANNDKFYFYDSEMMQRRESWAKFILLKAMISRPFAAVCFIGLLVVFFSGPLMELLPNGNAGRAALFAIFVCGAVLRFAFGPSAPAHCNSHGVDEIRSYLSDRYDRGLNEPYGHVFPATMRTALAIAGNSEENIFKINMAIGSLAILGIWLFAAALFEKKTAAYMATAFFALSPSQIWMSGTEYQTPLFSLLAFFGLAAAIMAVRKKSMGMLFAATLLVGVAASMRVVTVGLVPIAFLFAAREVDWRRKGDYREFGAFAAQALIVLTGVVAIHVKNIDILNTNKMMDESPLMGFYAFFFDTRNILWDPTLTPMIVPPLAAAGLIALFQRDKKLALALLMSFAIFVPLTFSVTDCRTTSLRYQSQAHWIYYILAAAVFSSAGPARAASAKKIALAVAIAALVLNSAYGISFLARGDEEMNEYWFLRETAAEIASGTTIYLPDVKAVGGLLITDFPGYMNDFKVVKGVPGDESAKDGLVYLGLDCYRYDGAKERKIDFTPSGLRKECADVCGSLGVKIVYKKKLDARLPDIGFQKRFYSISKSFPVVSFIKCEQAVR